MLEFTGLQLTQAAFFTNNPDLARTRLRAKYGDPVNHGAAPLDAGITPRPLSVQTWTLLGGRIVLETFGKGPFRGYVGFESALGTAIREKSY